MATAECESNNDRLWHMLKALGHPVRLEIVRFVREHPHCICNEILLQLPDDCTRAQSTLSQHLKILREAELVVADFDGSMTTYTIHHEHLGWLSEQITRLNNEASAFA
ncbi:MAG TPA: metalloregulator ArsR/SmtB family transcription factor [Roseiflexaceae bacterium]|jgi:DNA-binding transcriptional ArsR family regulator|nr:metalloregulator ArsR/SmtB family transcription factor [Roseiflexaceae bacterium]